MKTLTLIFTFSIIATFSHATPSLVTLLHTQQINETALSSGSCIYKIIITTSCSSPRLTTDAIDILIGDADGTQIFASPDPNTGLFKQCGTDIFAVHADCIGKICNMHFVRVGTDGWIPETAIVYHRDYPPITFNFDSFLPSGVPFGVNYCEHY